MATSIDSTIALALQYYLATRIRNAAPARSFFRLEGFAVATYQALLAALAAENDSLAGVRLVIRTTGSIEGYKSYEIEQNRSATWYRNNIDRGESLVLIFNRRTSDAQSLKNLFTVSETSLTHDGLPHLIDASFQHHQLNDAERKTLSDFIRRLARSIPEPQLRDVAAFLLAVDATIVAHPDTGVAGAIGAALPQLGLFRCRGLTEIINTSRGDALLREIHRAARLGAEVLDERNRTDLLAKIEATTDLVDDSAYNGHTPKDKRALLRRFLNELVIDREQQIEVFEIDWSEVQSALFRKARKSINEMLRALSREVQQALESQGLQLSNLPPESQDLIATLSNGQEPEADAIEELLHEQSEALGRTLSSRLRRLIKTRVRRHSDFVVGLTAVATELLHARQNELQPGTRLRVSTSLEPDTYREQLGEALAAFRILYRGIETFFPAIDWNLTAAWSGAESPAQQLETPEEDEERERVIRREVPFRITLNGPDGVELARADLIWQYRSDSPAATTLLALQAARAALPDTQMGPLFALDVPRAPVPIYNRCLTSNEIGDLDLRRPRQSLGAWFDGPTNLRQLLEEQVQRRTRPQGWAAIDQALGALEQAWGTFLLSVAEQGVLTADIPGLLQRYEELMVAAISGWQAGGEAHSGYRVLNQAWIIGPPTFDSWAIVPLLHPLKLLWWRERAQAFGRVIEQLLEPMQRATIVDETRYRRELATTYGSSNFPAVVVLPRQDGVPDIFLPVEEADGYELYCRAEESAEAYGLDTDLLAEDENEKAAQHAVDGLVAVIEDYIETYPFVRDGIEIFLLQCRNGALPGMLIDRLNKSAERRQWRVRLSVVVHTTDRGAPLFRRVSEWLQGERPQTQRAGQEYFPPVTIKVLECSYNNLFERVEDTDMVILADVLTDQGQRISTDITSADEDLPIDGYLPVYRAQQEPFERYEKSRLILLNAPHQPKVARLFHLAQWAATRRKAVRLDNQAMFYRELSLDAWEPILTRLHHIFNWVVCYDTTIDRFLMEETFQDAVQVIRYSLGLGTKRQHNLTVSSSRQAQSIVESRLTVRLVQLFPQAPEDFRRQIAQQLVTVAKRVSGDIVLRAAGPGAFLNELIGMVVAKFEIERRYLANHPDALMTWILLDDFEHWFTHKFPDLLFVAIETGPDEQLILHTEVIEAKCISELAFAVEASDAQRQVVQGVNRLVRAFAPGNEHLDALYWYDQLYRAIVGNLLVEPEHQGRWELFRNHVHEGDFILQMSGQTWIFCHDGQAGISSGPLKQEFTIPAPDELNVSLQAHLYGRNELCKALSELITTHGIKAPTPQALEPPDAESRQAEPEESDTIDIAINPQRQMAEVKLAATISSAVGTSTVALPAVISVPTAPSDNPPPDPEQQWLIGKARDLERALRQRGVQILPIEPALADVGPSVVRFKLRLRPNESLRKIQGVAEDLARDLALASTPIIDNVLRTNFVGVDIPRERAQMVELRPLLEGLGTPGPAELPIVIGVTPDGALVVEDLSEFPHLLVAGATNSGKSVFLRSMLLSLMTQYPAGKLELLIVDPKRTDFTFFGSVPYLRGSKVIVERNEARDALLELVRGEMPRRQNLIANRSTKVKLFNQRYPDEALPPIVALIDEYALLVSMMDKKERELFEQDLMILAAAARSVGIHLVLATQRPSADIVTSTLKANLDARIAFRVASNTNSRVVLDTTGAENLLGRGDMLFRRPSGEIIRLQAPHMDEEQMQLYLAALIKATR